MFTVSPDEWRIAEYYLLEKPNGTVLPYSALLSPDTGKAIPRPSRPKLFDNYQAGEKSKPANTFHSFIKIDGEIFAIAQGKASDALIGKGQYGKVKLIQNKKGELAVVKIETTNTPLQQEESRILKDRALPDGSPLSRGKVERCDKSKYYTHLAYLGVGIDKLLMNYQLQVALTEPASHTMQDQSLYVYAKNKQLYCKFIDETLIKERPLPHTEDYVTIQEKLHGLSSDYELFIKTEISTAAAPYTPRFCTKMPSEMDINNNTLYLYPINDGLGYAFRDNDGKLTRGLSTQKHPYLSQTLSHTLLDGSLTKSIYASLGFYPRGGLFPLELDESSRLQMAIDIALQVDALHRGLPSSSRSGTPTAHQDIKTENIVIDARGQCHLIDFGFATTTPDKLKTQPTGTPMYLPPLSACFFLTEAEFDVVALKRILTMPADLNCALGKHTISQEERKRRSVLTDDMVKKFNLTELLQTSSFKSKDMTAMALAAILITVQLDLGIDYDILKKDPTQAAMIVAYYRHRKNSPTLKQDILKSLQETDLATRVPLAEAGVFEEVTQEQPLAYLAQYLKKNNIPGKITSIEKSRVLIEAINMGFLPGEIETLLNKETLQIRGIIRAKQFELTTELAAHLQGDKSSQVSILLTFAENKSQAQHYLKLYNIYSQLELQLPTLDLKYQKATRNLVACLNEAILELDNQDHPVERFKRFHDSIDTAVKNNRAVLETNTGLTKFLDDLCTVLASLVVFYPFVYVYQKKNDIHYSFFKPQTAIILDEIQEAQQTLLAKHAPIQDEKNSPLSDNPADEGIIACMQASGGSSFF